VQNTLNPRVMHTYETDVVVVGAGSAGISAAVAAAETGSKVTLIESSAQIGGTLAWQLLEHSAGFHDVEGHQVVGGFGQRLVDVLKEYGSSPGHIRDDVGYTATRTPLNHAELAMAESVILSSAGVQVMLLAPVVDVIREGTRVQALVLEAPEGRVALKAKCVVDASGDAVVAHLAGADFQRDVAAKQPASLTFKINAVDFGELLAYARANPADIRPGNIIGDPTDECVNLWGFGQLLAQGREHNGLSLHRTEMHLAGWPRRGEAIVNVTRVPLQELDSGAQGAAYLALQQQVFEFARWFRTSVPGCSNSYISAVANRIGVRESRRVFGLSTLTQDDVLNGKRKKDAIATSAFPIDVHDARKPGLSHTDSVGSGYDIPYGCLVVAGLDNLFAAGRCISSTHEANGSVRITATCFATGEAAGTAASIASRRGLASSNLQMVPELQESLRRRGVLGLENGPSA
jgi:ribulose 1,5-bisphosphate synthetase/thiazole synthase